MKRILSIFLALAAVAGAIFYFYSDLEEKKRSYGLKNFKHQFVIEQAHSLLGFNLVDPQQAPAEVRDSVMRGYRAILNTPYYAPQYCKNELSCTNCHFCAGDTLGGKNGGISLVGVTKYYPKFSKRDGKTISLADRIHNCFERSMNGIAPAKDSQLMNDMIAYLKWISQEVEHIDNIPWLGLPKIVSDHKPDPVQGKKDYIDCCSSCHQTDGQGGGKLGTIEGKTIPPLWGPNSFNDGAGMSTANMLAPFIYLNMPYQQASLTEEQALDITAYIREQPRPVF